MSFSHDDETIRALRRAKSFQTAGLWGMFGAIRRDVLFLGATVLRWLKPATDEAVTALFRPQWPGLSHRRMLPVVIFLA
jgi:hypothetical protein